MVVMGNFLGNGEKNDRFFGIGFGMFDCAATKFGMGFHDLPLFRRQFARLEQDVIGNADFADIVQRG
ncbi:MAG: hypothetical protein ACD_10C00706G0001 [uncultured bacterium]|nr:MAG: hypothetical protein ACD_10C00706G0001 [uncultured bacterium]